MLNRPRLACLAAIADAQRARAFHPGKRGLALVEGKGDPAGNPRSLHQPSAR